MHFSPALLSIVVLVSGHLIKRSLFADTVGWETDPYRPISAGIDLFHYWKYETRKN